MTRASYYYYPWCSVRCRRDHPGMRTRAIHPGDLVMVNKRGRIYYARVLGAGSTSGLSVEPLDPRISWRHATAREIVDHWTHARRDRDERPPTGQLALKELPT